MYSELVVEGTRSLGLCREAANRRGQYEMKGTSSLMNRQIWRFRRVPGSWVARICVRAHAVMRVRITAQPKNLVLEYAPKAPDLPVHQSKESLSPPWLDLSCMPGVPL